MPRPRRPRTTRVVVESSTEELTFQDHLKLYLGSRPGFRWWRQNCGVIPVRNLAGKVERYFHAGPPTGACDMSGIVCPEGWRLEVELKSSTGKRSDQQIAFAEMIEAFGGVYALVQYDDALSLEQNLAEAERIIVRAIEARRRRAA